MRRACTEENCGRPAFGRGLCQRHYQRARYYGTLPTETPVRECLQCGESFQSRKWNAFYCSRRCNENSRYVRAPRREKSAFNCEHCGATAERDRSDQRYCSIACGQAARNQRVAAETLARKAASGRTCDACDKPIDPTRHARVRYCDAECKRAMRRAATYGLTRDELHALIEQHDRCAICGGSDWGKKGPQVDHDHDTGRVRGVLCSNCNTGLGHFRDDAALLRKAVRYLT